MSSTAQEAMSETLGGKVQKEVAKRFKILALLEDKTPSEKIRELVEQEVERNDKVSGIEI